MLLDFLFLPFSLFLIPSLFSFIPSLSPFSIFFFLPSLLLLLLHSLFFLSSFPSYFFIFSSLSFILSLSFFLLCTCTSNPGTPLLPSQWSPRHRMRWRRRYLGWAWQWRGGRPPPSSPSRPASPSCWITATPPAPPVPGPRYDTRLQAQQGPASCDGYYLILLYTFFYYCHTNK